MLLRLTPLFLSLLCVSVTLVAHADVYRDPNFRISLLDAGAHKVCKPESYEHGSGIWILLQDGNTNCDDKNAATMRVYASYNTLEPADFTSVLNFNCAATLSRIGGMRVKAPSGLQIGGKRSATCRVDGDSERIEVIVLTQLPMGDAKRSVRDAPGINLYANLQTTKDRYRLDLSEFKKMLRSTRILPAER